MGQKPRSEIICRCNSVSRDTIEKAIRGGCDTLNKIFDETTAGVGPCGGSCRRKLKPFLEYYLEHKTFPEKVPVAEPMTEKVPGPISGCGPSETNSPCTTNDKPKTPAE